MKELADDVGGGGDAEDDGAEDLLPPGQQQHRVFSPAVLRGGLVPSNQADGAVAFLPVAFAVGEEVPVVCREDKRTDPSVSSVPSGQHLCICLRLPWSSDRMGTEERTGLRCCIRRGSTCRYSDTCQIRQNRPELESGTENLKEEDGFLQINAY